MEPLGKGAQHIGADLETRGGDSGADRGDDVLRAAPVAQEPSRAIPGQASKAAAPTAVGQRRAGSGGIGHDHGEAVGVADQGGFPRAKQERVARRRIAGLVDEGPVLLHGLAHRSGMPEVMEKAFDIRFRPRIEGRPIEKPTDAPADDRAGSQQDLGADHSTWIATKVRSSWLWAPAENSSMSARSEDSRACGESSPVRRSDRFRRSIP